MTKVTVAEVEKYGEALEGMSVQFVYKPKVGFTVRILDPPENFQPPDDYVAVYRIDGFVNYKNETALQLDQYIGDIQCYTRDLEASIISKVEDKILNYEHVLTSYFESVMELMCLHPSLLMLKIKSGPFLKLVRTLVYV